MPPQKTPKQPRRFSIKWMITIGVLFIIGSTGLGFYYFRRPSLSPPAGAVSNNTPISSPITAQTSNTELNPLPIEAQLTLGTINLEGTDLAITPEQASTLLPLWDDFKTLNQNIIPNQAQNNAQQTVVDDEQKGELIQKIQAAMTLEQLKAIAEMQLTEQSAKTILQGKGVILSGQTGGGFIEDLTNALIQILEQRAAG